MTDIMFFALRAFLITVMTIGMMATLTEFRFRPRKLLGILAVYGIWVIASSVVLLYLGGELLLLRLFFFFISVPAIFLSYWAANDTPAQAVFNYITQIILSMLVVSVLRLITESLGMPRLVNILLMMTFYVVTIFLEGRFLRRPFRLLMHAMPTRWGVLTLIPCAFFFYLIFLAAWPDIYLENPFQRVYLYAAVIPMVLVYVSVFKSLLDQYNIQAERHSAALMRLQITALKEKLQKTQEAEEHIRIQRHDLRHQLQAVKELVAQGNQAAALDFLEAAQQRLDERKVTRWCRPPILDAVFSSYFDQASHHGIPVEAKISLPDTLPVDEGELAIVLANTLENAIYANLDLPREDRQIRCKMVGLPGVMLEVSNPCAGDISFDSSGLPVAQREGHGLGIQSICAFCRKNGAVCQFDLTDGWFRVMLVL